jgi:ATP sulfurylase
VLFPEYQESIFIDPNIDIRNDLLFKSKKGIINIPFHQRRKCLYKECEYVMRSGLDSKEAIESMVALLKQNKMPKNYGLLENCIIYRKHNDIKVKKMCDEWWSLIEKYSKRDQCSLTFVLWKMGIKVEDVSFPFGVRSSLNFIINKHLKMRQSIT